MGISIGGLSGLDTEKIITQLMELEQIPIKKVQQRIDRYTLQKNTFETFNLKLLSLKSSAETLLDSATWQTKNVTVSDSTKISATASSSASQGTLKFNVTQLGKSESIYSGGAVGAAGESSDTLITNFATASSGVLKIDIDGTETSITYDVNTDTINTLISKINQSSANVTAFYDKNTDKFYITSNTAGNKTITITDDSGGNMAELLKLRAADSPVVENGTSTQFYINDMAQMFTTDTNSYTVNGVTVNFLNTGSTTVVVKNDSSAIVEKIKDFVNKYNDVQDFIKEQTKLTTASTTSDKTTDVSTRAPLAGNYLATDVSYNLNAKTLQAFSELRNAGQYSMLTEIGISLGAYGTDNANKLVVDEQKLQEAVENNPEQVRLLFGYNTSTPTETKVVVNSGIAHQIKSYLNPITRFRGLIANEQSALQSMIDSLNTNIDKMNERLTTVEENYRKQFSRMEQQLARLNSQGDYFSSQLASLSKSK